MKFSPLTPAQRCLVENHLYLVQRIITARITPNYSVPDMEYADLYQTGCLALCKAVSQYDDTRPFIPYAKRVIYNALIDYCRHSNRNNAPLCSLERTLCDASENLCIGALLESPDGTTAFGQLQTEETIAYIKAIESKSSGVLQKGIHALLEKAQGHSNTDDLSRQFGVSTNCVRAWMSLAAKMLRKNPELYDLLSA